MFNDCTQSDIEIDVDNLLAIFKKNRQETSNALFNLQISKIKIGTDEFLVFNLMLFLVFSPRVSFLSNTSENHHLTIISTLDYHYSGIIFSNTSSLNA
jgi:hypothetical protein